MSNFEEDRKELEQRYYEYRRELTPATANSGNFNIEQYRHVLNRLAYWAGVFDGFSPRARAHQEAKEFLLPLRLSEIVHEIDRLRVSWSEGYSARVSQTPTPTPPPPPPGSTEIEIKKINLAAKTNTDKATAHFMLDQKRLSGQLVLLDEDPGPEYCGAIHVNCGPIRHGRCKKKMAHGVDIKDYSHRCSACGMDFSW
jgi:hypothetical protein